MLAECSKRKKKMKDTPYREKEANGVRLFTKGQIKGLHSPVGTLHLWISL